MGATRRAGKGVSPGSSETLDAGGEVRARGREDGGGAAESGQGRRLTPLGRFLVFDQTIFCLFASFCLNHWQFLSFGRNCILPENVFCQELVKIQFLYFDQFCPLTIFRHLTYFLILCL